MPSSLLTAATDIFVIAGAAAVATAAFKPQFMSFETSLGAEYDEDSPVAIETNDAISAPEQCQSPLEEVAGYDKKAPIVTVTEVAVTPPLVAEIQEGGFFAGAAAA